MQRPRPAPRRESGNIPDRAVTCTVVPALLPAQRSGRSVAPLGAPNPALRSAKHSHPAHASPPPPRVQVPPPRVAPARGTVAGCLSRSTATAATNSASLWSLVSAVPPLAVAVARLASSATSAPVGRSILEVNGSGMWHACVAWRLCLTTRVSEFAAGTSVPPPMRQQMRRRPAVCCGKATRVEPARRL